MSKDTLSADTDAVSSTCDCGHPAYMHTNQFGCWSTRGGCDALCTCAGYRDTGMRPYAVTLRHDDGTITITTSATTAEHAVRIVCAAECAPWRSAIDVVEVSA